ncbi:MAG: rhomboid family intramembrane serine protease [Candidatus Bathyarchaeia archaeon]
MFRNSETYMPTYTLIAVNVAVYGYTSILSGSINNTSDWVVSSYGQNNFLVLNGEAWRLLTAIFIHANLLHIVGNMLFLLIFGLRAEKLFDLKEYLSVYFLSGLAGGLLTLLMGPDTWSIGASGAIFGMLGACTIYARRSIGQSIMYALLYSFFFLVINIGPDVNVLAHIGGLVTGLLIGYLLAMTRKPQQTVTYQYNYPSFYSG